MSPLRMSPDRDLGKNCIASVSATYSPAGACTILDEAFWPCFPPHITGAEALSGKQLLSQTTDSFVSMMGNQTHGPISVKHAVPLR